MTFSAITSNLTPAVNKYNFSATAVGDNIYSNADADKDDDVDCFPAKKDTVGKI